MGYIDDVFGSSGLLAGHMEGYEPRESQIRMAQAVHGKLAESGHLVVEAPCGVGKSLAYGVPAAWHAAHADKRVVIATANIALQEQLVEKDLPFLKRVLPWDFSFILLKGRNNFLCLDRWMIEQQEGRFKKQAGRRDLAQYRSILKWAARTKTGDRSELDFTPSPFMWRFFSVGGEDCKGGDCRHRGECFANVAGATAARCGIIVTNYHMLFAHLAIRASSGRNMLLPAFDAVVCDEAHKAADIARDFNGFRITERSVRFASHLLGRLHENEAYEALEDAAARFFADLKKLYRSPAYRIRFREPPDVRWDGLRAALLQVSAIMADAADQAKDRDERAGLERAQRTAARMSWNIQSAMTMKDENFVYFLEEMPRGGVVLMGKPIHVADFLRSELFEKSDSVIMTSATLAVNGGFQHIIEETGAPDPEELIVDSPFDFSQQALLVIPEDMPPANDKAFPDAVAEAVIQAIRFADGRVLGLFTSYKVLNSVHARVLDEFLEEGKYTILRQGERPRTALVADFRKDINSVLLGTESFWTGVDVPGESLSCVIIDRLPFQSPGDPVLDAVSAKNSRWFMSYSVPRAVIAFKQGFGRLIRRMDDRGVVVLLDRRIVTKPYGRTFLASLPPAMRSRKLESVGKFLKRKVRTK